jgi:hypothetical protein
LCNDRTDTAGFWKPALSLRPRFPQSAVATKTLKGISDLVNAIGYFISGKGHPETPFDYKVSFLRSYNIASPNEIWYKFL